MKNTCLSLLNAFRCVWAVRVPSGSGFLCKRSFSWKNMFFGPKTQFCLILLGLVMESPGKHQMDAEEAARTLKKLFENVLNQSRDKFELQTNEIELQTLEFELQTFLPLRI